MLKINRRPKDDDSDDDNNKDLLGMHQLADEWTNQLSKKGYNCDSFMEIFLQKMGKKDMINQKEFGWKTVFNSSQSEYDEKGIYFCVK